MKQLYTNECIRASLVDFFCSKPAFGIENSKHSHRYFLITVNFNGKLPSKRIIKELNFFLTMADKKALEKRSFYKNKILQIEEEVNDEKSFEQFSWYELIEVTNNLASAHEKFELKCLSVCYDSELGKEELAELNKDNSSVDKLFVKIKAKINKRIDELKDNEKACATEKKDANESEEMPKEKRELKNTWGVFNGKTESFSEFFSKFTTAMDIAKDLNYDEKFQLLLVACEGEAKNAVINFTYKEALDNLENVYGSVYRKMQCYTQKFLNIQPIKVASPNSLQAFYDELCKFETEIKRCVKANENDFMMVFVVIEKLDKDTGRAWERHRLGLAESWAAIDEASSIPREVKNHLPSFENLKAFIKSEIKMLLGEKSNASGQTSKSVMNELCDWEEKKSTPYHLQCKLCGNIHPIYKCQIFINYDLQKKKDYVRDNFLCVKCLRRSHFGNCKNVPSNNPCPRCDPEVYHNSSLCPKNNKEIEKPNPSQEKAKDWDDEEDWDKK